LVVLRFSLPMCLTKQVDIAIILNHEVPAYGRGTHAQ
jgi:hypothetical protein